MCFSVLQKYKFSKDATKTKKNVPQEPRLLRLDFVKMICLDKNYTHIDIKPFIKPSFIPFLI